MCRQYLVPGQGRRRWTGNSADRRSQTEIEQLETDEILFAYDILTWRRIFRRGNVLQGCCPFLQTDIQPPQRRQFVHAKV